MNIKQSFSLAIKSLLGSKMRSFLTMLGIIIGVGSVIVLVSIMDGMNKQTIEKFESMGTNLINVTIIGRGGNRAVTADDMQTLADENKDVIKSISPSVMVGNTTVKFGNDNVATTIMGGNEKYAEITNTKVQSGRFLEYIDIERRQKNCVVGSYIVKELFDGVDPIGKTLKIVGDDYIIVGTLEAKQSSQQGTTDDRVVIPYTLARNYSRNARVSSYSMSAANKDTVDKAVEVTEKLLLSIYSSSDSYRVFKQSDSLNMINETSKTMTMVLVGVAAISLLVGGIGIMNIMLVSVTERTREIGIRKSLGARRRDIMSQFVVEAATTSSIGGVLGIVLGIISSYIAGNLMKIPTTPSGTAILIAFGVSAFIGITFGYFPASKASKLNPIEALRYD